MASDVTPSVILEAATPTHGCPGTGMTEGLLTARTEAHLKIGILGAAANANRVNREVFAIVELDTHPVRAI
jgi:hypothetical protein